MQRLEETKRMLQSLEDDAEAAKGWPQVPSSDASSGDDQALKKANESEAARADDTKLNQAKSKKSKPKEQKKKKKKGKR
jgi:hypothetical protein